MIRSKASLAAATVSLLLAGTAMSAELKQIATIAIPGNPRENLKHSIEAWRRLIGRTTADADEGFKPIFNGKDLSGWHVSRSNHHGTTMSARVENGLLVLEQNPIGEGGLLLTDKRYRDFELYRVVKPDGGCDGGIFLRSNEEGTAYQITIDYMIKNSVGSLITEGIPAMTGTGVRRPPDWQKI